MSATAAGSTGSGDRSFPPSSSSSSNQDVHSPLQAILPLAPLVSSKKKLPLTLIDENKVLVEGELVLKLLLDHIAARGYDKTLKQGSKKKYFFEDPNSLYNIAFLPDGMFSE